MPALVAVQESEIGEHRLGVLIQADRQRLLHLVDEQRQLTVQPGRLDDRGAGRRGQSKFGNRPEDLDFDPPRGDAGHGMVPADPAGVGRQFRALDLAGPLHDDAVVGQDSAARECLRGGDEFVKLRDRIAGAVVTVQGRPRHPRSARESAATNYPLRGADDGLLHGLLSFVALTARAPIVAFLSDLLDRLSIDQRAGLAGLLLRLHASALYPRTDTTFSDYEPLRLTVTARHAAWSSNLVVLAVLTAGEITGEQLFPHDSDPAASWRNQAMMWRAQLTSEEEYGLTTSIAVDRVWDGQDRVLRLRRLGPAAIPPATDMYWTYNIPPDHPNRHGIFAWGGHSPRDLQRKSNFTGGKSDDFMSHALLPFAHAFPTIANVFVTVDTGRPLSATNALLAALVAPYADSGIPDSAYLDLAQVTQELAGASNADRDYDAYLKIALTVLLSAVEQGLVPATVLQRLSEATADRTDDEQLMALVAGVRAALADDIPGGPS